MYLTHTFANRETLFRAHSWLTQLGFRPRQLSDHSGGIPRLKMPVEPHRLAAAQMLINAAESADPNGFPSFWDKVGADHATRTSAVETADHQQTAQPHASVIGWHPLD
jgi:hypothetical protein